MSVVQTVRYSYQISKKFKFFDRFSKKTQTSNFMKILPVRAELFHSDGRKDGETDRQTDMSKQIVAFGNFVIAPKTATKQETSRGLSFEPKY